MTVEESEFFTKEELQCKCGCGQARMDEDFMQMMDILRFKLNKPVRLNSAYRCPEHNNNVSSTGYNGPHTTGKAVDVRCSGKTAHAILKIAAGLDFDGIGISQKGDHGGRFIHLDTLRGDTRPWVWSY